MAKLRMSLSSLSALLVAAPTFAAVPQVAPEQIAQIRAQEGARAQRSITHLMGIRSQLGLDADSTLNQKLVDTDSLGQTHTFVHQKYRGVKVWGGEAIAHMDKNGANLPVTSSLKAGINLNVAPALQTDEVLAIAHRDLSPKGNYASKPTAELVIFPVTTQTHVRAGNDATAYEHQVVRYALAYYVHTDLQNGVGETKQTDYMIDAHTGAILKQWSALETTAAVGTGKSQYSGNVSINTNSITGGYELRDTTRGTTTAVGGVGNAVTNLNHATSGTGTIYTDADNIWGDNANYVEGSSTTAANGETAAVDAAFGVAATWDMFKKVLGRNGINNAGKSTYLRVHYSNAYDNAFWDDTCFCMTFGDGNSFTTLTSIDVAGHEMAHGVCSTSANLTYSGESGGLNESDSDIFGTMVEFYGQGGGLASGSTTIPTTGGNWTIGEQLAATPLRYMYKPSLDGTSPDAWSSTIGSLNVHYSSGPNNRMFYFLSQGATTSGNTSTSYLPSGMTGIGNDHAARIWYRALTTYMTSSTNYAGARAACMSAAGDLYGTGSAEYAAVQNAYHGINVGAAASGSTALASSITTPSGNVTIASGTSQSFVGSASGGTSPYTYSWTFGDGGTSAAASTSHTYSNTGSTNVVYTATFKVTDNLGATSSSTRSITVTPAGTGGGTEKILNGGFESGATSWTQTSGVIGANGPSEPAHAGTQDAWMNGYGSAHTDYIYQQIVVPTAATLTFWLHIDTAETTTTSAYDTLKVQVLNTAGTVLGTLATYSNLNKNTGYTQKSLSLSAYAGQTVRIKFLGTEDSSLQTSFVVDDVSVK